MSLKWCGRTSGIYHAYPDVQQSENVLEVFTDSDWASDRQTRRSVSCWCIFFGGCMIFSASRTQKVVSLCSAEAEVYVCSSGSSDAILLARLLSWLTGRRTWIYVCCLYTDSSGARGILQRQGVGGVCATSAAGCFGFKHALPTAPFVFAVSAAMSTQLTLGQNVCRQLVFEV